MTQDHEAPKQSVTLGEDLRVTVGPFPAKWTGRAALQSSGEVVSGSDSSADKVGDQPEYREFEER